VTFARGRERGREGVCDIVSTISNGPRVARGVTGEIKERGNRGSIGGSKKCFRMIGGVGAQGGLTLRPVGNERESRFIEDLGSVVRKDKQHNS